MIKQTIPIFAISEYLKNTDSTGSHLRYNYDYPLTFDHEKDDVTFRLLSATYWWNFPNISEKLQNNKLRFFVGATQYNVTFENGLYSIDSINNNMAQFFANNALPTDLFVFFADDSTYKTSVQINVAGVYINWANSSIGSILGYTNVNSGPGNGGLWYDPPNLTKVNTISSVLINTNFTTGAYVNGKRTSVIANIPPDVSVGDQVYYSPNNTLECKVTNYTLDEISFYLTGEKGQALDTNGEAFTITGEFIVREKQK